MMLHCSCSAVRAWPVVAETAIECNYRDICFLDRFTP